MPYGFSDFTNRLKSSGRESLESVGSRALIAMYGQEATPQTLLQKHAQRVKDANDTIAQKLSANQAYCVARLGNDEFETMEKWRRRERKDPFRSVLESLASGDPFFSLVRSRIRARASGLRPLSAETLKRFHALMVQSSAEVDLLASWIRGESYYGELFANSGLCDLVEIEPYRSSRPWSEALEGKKVLVVHPFDETIRHQYLEKREKLFRGTNVLPTFGLLTYRPPRSHFGEVRNAQHWFELLDRMVVETSALDFDAAIIGAGPFGLPLAAALKRRGKVAVHLGGATQLLFGIIGKRWQGDQIISRYRNEHWVRPSPSETPSPRQRRRSPYW